ncbi:MAG: tRNA adenosine(34) deaminase TadA [Acidimicrobiales bacterium]
MVANAGTDDEAAMRLAIEEAAHALAHGDVPVGAVALASGKVIGSRHNEREQLGDPTAHAELLLMRDLANRDGWRLGDVTIAVTLEPCAMCAGAMVNARLGRLVYGAFDPRAGATGSLYNLLNDPRLNHEVPVTSGVLETECAALLNEFFASKRGDRPPG